MTRPGDPRGRGCQGGNREQQTGQRVCRSGLGCGPGSAVLRCPGHVHKVRQAGQLQALQTPPDQPSNQPPHTEHWPPLDTRAGAGAESWAASSGAGV